MKKKLRLGTYLWKKMLFKGKREKPNIVKILRNQFSAHSNTLYR